MSWQGPTNAARPLNDVRIDQCWGIFSDGQQSIRGDCPVPDTMLNVITLPPTIVLEPTNETVLVGAQRHSMWASRNLSLLTYQWVLQWDERG